LKLHITDYAPAIAVAFPRLKKRGPIEAATQSIPALVGVRFPRLKKRGPIEA